MQKICLLLSLAGAVLFCGCDKQTKINTEKIAVLSQKLVVLQQIQAKQLADIQTQLTSLAPMLDKKNNSYFEKNHEDAIFFHTNTLYLLLMVDRKIEAELQAADAERAAEHSLAYYYHTNENGMMSLGVAQTLEAMTDQESRIENNVNAETRRAVTVLGEALQNQIKLSAPDVDEKARRSQMEATVAQMKRDLDMIKTRLGITNLPAAGP